MNTDNKISALFIGLFLFFSQSTSAKIIIGSKNFTEQLILGEIAAQYLEHQGEEVERKLNLAGSHIVFEALKQGSIDLYPEYTGTGYISILKLHGESNPETIWNIVHKEFMQQYNLNWSKPLGFNNTYALAVRNSDEKFKSITNIEQLKNLLAQSDTQTIKMGAPHAFFTRPDGLKGLSQWYTIDLNKVEQINLEPGLMYQAINNKRVDIITAFSTDARIIKFKLDILDDNKQYFPPYHAAWLAKDSLVKSNPSVQKLFSAFENKIDNNTMQKLNQQVDEYGYAVDVVAKNFLEQSIFKSKTQTNLQKSSSEKLGFLRFIKSQQQFLFKKTFEHAQLCFFVILCSIVLAVPLGVYAQRNKVFKSIVFFISNVLQTVPSLALLGFLIPVLGIGIKPSIVALLLYSLLPIITNTYTGIVSIPKHTKESALSLGMNQKQLLWYILMPLALPQIFAGIRIAAVITIGTATLASLIGAGGLGDPIFQGISQANTYYILLGAIPAAAMALLVDAIFKSIEKHVSWQ
ncbi:MAG TPA: glycine betaine ABC transporter substrate-binding protein [Oligoflexia bacterium]|nr:glycine betaine ABC transporter substrate-binding protein [Oligoflexia bacterium]HMR24630.1 glycine betaine ABC transporter substrate-binding protein [Oligoflexia bacterium]